jgi:hypothetical protein
MISIEMDPGLDGKMDGRTIVRRLFLCVLRLEGPLLAQGGH